MSRRYARFKLLAGLCLLWAAGATGHTFAQVVLTAPSGINGPVGSTLPIEVEITSVPDSGIATFKVTLDYRPEVMQFDENSVVSAGTLAEDWSININAMEDGRVVVGGFALGSNYITSEGTLVTLVASLETGGETDLVLDSLGTEIEDPAGMLVNTLLENGKATAFRDQNTSPEFTEQLDDQTIVIGSAFTYTYEAGDADGDVLTFDLLNPPLGAEIDPTTGVLTFTPAGTGEFQLRASITDGSDVVVSDVAVLTVRESNSAPAFASDLPPTRLMLLGQSITFTYTAEDDDGDALTYILINPPAGADIDSQTGLFSFTPAGEGAFEIEVSVTDGQVLVSAPKVTITVRLTNAAPEFTAELENQEITSASIPFAFTYGATDADGDSLTFTLQDPPDGATLDAAGTLTFDPPSIIVGEYVMTVLISDGLDTTQTVASLTLVSGVNAEDPSPEIQYALHPHYPNPVRSSATLRYSILDHGFVRLAVYDLLGREVRVLVDEVQAAGVHEVQFPVLELPSGTYLYRLETSEGLLTRSMLVIR